MTQEQKNIARTMIDEAKSVLEAEGDDRLLDTLQARLHVGVDPETGRAHLQLGVGQPDYGFDLSGTEATDKNSDLKPDDILIDYGYSDPYARPENLRALLIDDVTKVEEDGRERTVAEYIVVKDGFLQSTQQTAWHLVSEDQDRVTRRLLW